MVLGVGGVRPRAVQPDPAGELREQVPVAGLPVGMGASLGGLAMLQAQRTWPGAFAGLFLQSASFFVPRFDRQESGFPRYARIVRFVRRRAAHGRRSTSRCRCR